MSRLRTFTQIVEPEPRRTLLKQSKVGLSIGKTCYNERHDSFSAKRVEVEALESAFLYFGYTREEED